MRRWLVSLAPVLLLANGGSCSSVHIAKPSDAYLTCSDEPLAPEGDPATGAVTDEQDATYKRDLRAAWYDCRSKLQYVSDWSKKLP